MTTKVYTGFQLKLDGNGWLDPGTQLSGAVTVPEHLLDDEQPLKLHLVLSGRSKIKAINGHGKNKSVTRSRAPLLHEVHDLQRGSGTEWPFSIPVPTQVQDHPDISQLETLDKDANIKRARNYWTHKWPVPKKDRERLFVTDKDQPLPPTFCTVIKSHAQIFATVEYQVAIYVMRHRPANPGFSFRESLNLKNKAPYSELAPLQVCSSVLVVPGSSIAGLDLSQMIKLNESLPYSPQAPNSEKPTFLSRIKSDRNGDMQNFDLEIGFPQALVPGKPIDLRITMSPPAGTDLSLLNLELQTIRAKLRRCTYVRTRLGWGAAHKYNYYWGTVLDVTGDIAKDQPLEWQPSTSGDGRMEKAVSWPVGPLDEGLPASFNTFNVCCIYELSVELSLKCNGREKKIKQKSNVAVAAGEGNALYDGGVVPMNSVKAVATNVAIRTLNTIGAVLEITLSSM